MTAAADWVVGEIRVAEGGQLPNIGATKATFYQLIAIHQGDRWASVCRELGLSSLGDSPRDALSRLERVVREAIEAESEGGPGAGWPMSLEELDEWIFQHEGREAISTVVFPIVRASI